MKVRFLRPWPYTPSRNRQVTLEYPAGFEGTVKRECGEAAVAAGAAEELADVTSADPSEVDADADAATASSRRGPARARRR